MEEGKDESDTFDTVCALNCGKTFSIYTFSIIDPCCFSPCSLSQLSRVLTFEGQVLPLVVLERVTLEPLLNAAAFEAGSIEHISSSLVNRSNRWGKWRPNLPACFRQSFMMT